MSVSSNIESAPKSKKLKMPPNRQITNYHKKFIIKKITLVGFGVLVLLWQIMHFSSGFKISFFSLINNQI